MSDRRRTAAGIGAAALACAGYALYALIKSQNLRQRYGNDDRILIQVLYAVAGLALAVVLAGWAVSALRHGRPPLRSGWAIAAVATLLAALVAFAYDGGRLAADHYRAAPGRGGVHGTLAVDSCTAQEYGFECTGTFRADDESFTVERVSAWPDTDPGSTMDGWVSGPRPLAMFDGAPGGWRDDLVPLYVLGGLWLALAGFLGVLVARRVRFRPPAA
ncbi:hypothetical protein [Dactylosporangium sp. CA-139066]|uniref:hypothetical protein n=1 Tax=Dactylosporangium sp. CA-139066 TaxID=3239930 RepID=UPI003D8C8615